MIPPLPFYGFPYNPYPYHSNFRNINRSQNVRKPYSPSNFSNCNTENISNLNNSNFDNKKDLPNDNFNDFFEILGLKLTFDDLLIVCILFFLYKEDVKDTYLYIALILLLLS